MEQNRPSALNAAIERVAQEGETMALNIGQVFNELSFDTSLIRNHGILSVDVGEGHEITLAKTLNPSKMVATEPIHKPKDVLSPKIDDPELQFPIQDLLDGVRGRLPQDIKEKVVVSRITAEDATRQTKEKDQKFGLVTRINADPNTLGDLGNFIRSALEVTTEEGMVLVSILEPEEVNKLKEVADSFAGDESVKVDVRPVMSTDTGVAITALGSYILSVQKLTSK